ncbi:MULTISPECIES: hypothetical protein [unclassified Moorena]|uniref:hypothetical protein n=1 Tax=unclassified Moorena TaxID=2683338 RepID=UPI0002F197AC|nr:MULTISPECIES: hypothetical protein [unclassified Moorena]NEQ17133.1 hypothetical protein [Moorena sp. SIO3E2]NES43691.1 hypothetical protein [Moorena sp. SIO2C4]NEQ08146.1 hypothetical protein [Moorena sp. SIO4E2]NER88120.1 hypothetical protein [Moorena sp. SIO3A2]NET65270.1 hypothetical protein [Moorena sp. SIO1G6]
MNANSAPGASDIGVAESRNEYAIIWFWSSPRGSPSEQSLAGGRKKVLFPHRCAFRRRIKFATGRTAKLGG